MKRIDPDIWLRLAAERPAKETLWGRLAIPDVDDRLIAALAPDGRRHLLVALRKEDTELTDSGSRGIRVTTKELKIPRHGSGRYVDIECVDPSGHDAFDLIGSEIAERLAGQCETAPEVVARVLAKWRRFWGQLPKKVLSREEQLGLFAELWFLSVWLLPRLRADEAVGRWRGPLGARHDFEWSGRSVEVKATTSVRGRIHRVHGVEQLTPPPGGELFFFSLHAREERGTTNSLPQLVASCRAAMGHDPDALDKFENLLACAGYSPAHEEEYGETRYRVLAEGLYPVAADFPRITPASFLAGVPPGVESLEYEINLATFDHLLVASSPTDIEQLD